MKTGYISLLFQNKYLVRHIYLIKKKINHTKNKIEKKTVFTQQTKTNL